MKAALFVLVIVAEACGWSGVPWNANLVADVTADGIGLNVTVRVADTKAVASVLYGMDVGVIHRVIPTKRPSV